MLLDLIGDCWWFVVFVEILVLVFCCGVVVFICTKVYGFAQLCTGVFLMFLSNFYEC